MGPIIRIGREIQCLLYVGFFFICTPLEVSLRDYLISLCRDETDVCGEFASSFLDQVLRGFFVTQRNSAQCLPANKCY